jgi:hypothetical protein
MASQHKPEDLLPNFAPPLGFLLASLEKRKNRQLTAEEIIECRDNAPCIMMQREHLEKLQENAGIDIDPENVLVDWQRRRIEFVDAYWPSIVLYVLTNNFATKECCDLLEAKGIEYEVEEHDEQLPELITRYASHYNPIVDEQEKSSLEGYTKNLVVRSKPFKSSEAIENATAILQLISELINKGALGISAESSSVMHSKAAWRLFNETLEEAPIHALIYSFVHIPVIIDGAYMSVGMNSLGQADYMIETNTLKAFGNADTTEELSNVAYELFRTLAVYQLEECPSNEFLSGQTFSMTPESKRLRLHIEPCSFFKETDIRFNPFGVWRLSLS